MTPANRSQSKTAGLGGIVEVRDVDRAEVAGFVVVERLFAAGVRGPDRALAPGRIEPVDPVDEDEARVADGPGRLDDQIEDVVGLLGPGLPAFVRVADRRSLRPLSGRG